MTAGGGGHTREYSHESAESYESGPAANFVSTGKKQMSMSQSKGNSFRRRAVAHG